MIHWNNKLSFFNICSPGIYAAEGYIVFVFPFVCLFVCHIRGIDHKVLPKSFMLKFLTGKAFIFGSWVPWRVCFYAISFGPRVHAPWWARGQNLEHLKKNYVAFSLMLIPSNNIMWSDIQMTWAFVSWGEGQCDLYFMVEWFCLISWRLFDGLMSNVWPQNKCMSQWPIFHGSVILSYILKTIWYMKVIL